MKRMARMSSDSVSFLLLAKPEKGDPKTGISKLLGWWGRMTIQCIETEETAD
jgi:hypothetical protein